jgi:hypothetical protein
LVDTPQNEAFEDPDSVETLWRLSLEALTKSILVWRGYGSRNKESKIKLGLAIVRAAMDMLDRHEDVKAVRDARERITNLLEQVQKDGATKVET